MILIEHGSNVNLQTKVFIFFFFFWRFLDHFFFYHSCFIVDSIFFGTLIFVVNYWEFRCDGGWFDSCFAFFIGLFMWCDWDVLWCGWLLCDFVLFFFLSSFF